MPAAKVQIVRIKSAAARAALPLLVIAALVALDQAVKRWAAANLSPFDEIPVINGFISFTYVENRGAAFGLLQNGRWFFIPVTSLILLVIIYFYVKLPQTRAYKFVRATLVLITAGAVGNFIDRLFNGYVVDMLEFKFITFPVFNVADMCVVTGTFALAFVMLFIVKD